ncbi:MAG: ATP-dependent DNA helicase chl1 [Candelina submexicana]|nr:MAG: ATP-dependent DNA helicase chl1 [Candelina submexicana]
MESPARAFHHPYQPYEIQNEFMNALYDCIEEGKIGIFESPTGTGKSLSLICGALTWLRNFKRKAFEDSPSNVDAHTDGEPDWMVQYARDKKKSTLIRYHAEMESKLARIRAKEKRQKERFVEANPRHKKTKLDRDKANCNHKDESSFVLDDYESDDDPRSSTDVSRYGGLSEETQKLIMKLSGNSFKEGEPEEVVEELKIFYCSRTHSQLKQFINELRRVQFPSAIPKVAPDNPQEPISSELGFENEEVKHLTLGSRKNLCINQKVLKLGGATAINERCLDLQQPGTPAESKCPYLPTTENETLVNSFRDHTLANIRDIEELGTLGKQLSICPYYASRPTIKPSEIVTLPYPLLLQKSAREALHLSLKGHVVIIDEAHNLLDAITNIHSISVSLSQLRRSRAQLGVYLQKFRNRLKGKNRIYVTQVVRLLDSLISYLGDSCLTSVESEGIVPTSNLMAGKGVDQINLYKLMRYLQESKLARKVDGYVIFADQQSPHADQELGMQRETRGLQRGPQTEASTPVLTHIQGFLLALMNPSEEGRMFYSKEDNASDVVLRYMLLDPTHHFREVVEEARAVILAGGTMSPMSDYINHLFNYVPAARIKTLSCGHVIPLENLTVWPIAKGSSGLDLEFTFEKRNSTAMMDDLGRTILNLCLAIPDGVVAFFPSYAYLDQVIQRWQKATGTTKTLWERLSQRKVVLMESKESANVEVTLAEYSRAIDSGKGGILLSVVGGKMSEGINFADKLGRAVIVVGLPFPNIHSPEWKEKLDYIERRAVDRGTTQSEAKALSREHYENACMRAVNQSIGRAIRHQNDYASIILMDKRYSSDRIQGKLPGWIRGSVVRDADTKPFTAIMSNLSSFFRAKNAA